MLLSCMYVFFRAVPEVGKDAFSNEDPRIITVQ